MGKFKKSLLKFWPVIFIIAVWVVFSAPYLFQQKVPYPAKYQVTFFSPWSYYQEFAGPVKNNAMPDVVDQIYPWKHFTIETLKSGNIPLWNPYNFAGNPHLANFQSAVFSPFNLLFFILPFVDAWSILILLQTLLAGIFMYIFMREMSVSKEGSLIGSIAFMFCGFIVVWLAYGTLSMAIAFLPLVLFAIERSFNKKSLWTLLLLSISIACSYFSGHVQASLYLTVYSMLYLIFKLLTTKNWKKFSLITLFFIVGIGIASLQILPTLSLYQQSVRSSIVYQGGQIPLNYLVTLFAPDFYGNPVTRNDWIGSYAEWASFIGIVPFVLALFAFIKTKHKYNYFFAIAGILALLFSSDTPFRQLLATSNIPIFATSIPSRMIVLFSFSFAVLAGFGFDNLQKIIKQNLKKQIIIIFSFFSLLLAVLWISLLIFHILPPDKTMLAQRNLILPTALFGFIALITLVSFFVKTKRLPVLGLILLALTTFDSLRFATKWMPFDPRNLVFPNIQVIQEIKKRIGNERVFGNLGTQVESYYGIQSLEGYDPLYIGRFGEFLHTSFSGDYVDAERSVAQLSDRGKYTERVLDLLGVGIIFHPQANTFVDWAFPVWADKGKYTLLYEDEKFQLFKNETALPRAKLFYNYEVIKNKKNLLKRFYSEDFDFRNILLLEEDPKTPKCEAGCEGNAKIISYTPNKVVISVNTNSSGLLFLSDSYYKNWKVKINGKEDKIYIADYAFRAVEVQKGKSTVEFYYSGLF
jgi:uncharacterized membrane protein YfhO